MTDEHKALIQSVLSEMEGITAIRFREAAKGEDVDFSVYHGRLSEKFAAFTQGRRPYRPIRFGYQSTFNNENHTDDNSSALRTIRHKIGHAPGLDNWDVLIGDTLPAVMPHDDVCEFQLLDELTIRLIHGKNPRWIATADTYFSYSGQTVKPRLSHTTMMKLMVRTACKCRR